MWGRKRVSLEVEEWSDYVWEGTRQTLTQTTGVLSLLPEISLSGEVPWSRLQGNPDLGHTEAFRKGRAKSQDCLAVCVLSKVPVCRHWGFTLSCTSFEPL